MDEITKQRTTNQRYDFDTIRSEYSKHSVATKDRKQGTITPHEWVKRDTINWINDTNYGERIRSFLTAFVEYRRREFATYTFRYRFSSSTLIRSSPICKKGLPPMRWNSTRISSEWLQFDLFIAYVLRVKLMYKWRRRSDINRYHLCVKQQFQKNRGNNKQGTHWLLNKALLQWPIPRMRLWFPRSCSCYRDIRTPSKPPEPADSLQGVARTPPMKRQRFYSHRLAEPPSSPFHSKTAVSQ